MTNAIETLKEVITEGFGIIKFFKTLNYPYSRRDEAEQALKNALETIVSENTDLSIKARDWLRDLQVLTQNFSSEQYWNSARTSEERQKTNTMKTIFVEQEEQHTFRVMSNVVVEHDVASDSLRKGVEKNLGKRQASFEESSSKKTKPKFAFDISFDEYVNAISAVEAVRADNTAAHTDPSWWGILDFRGEGVHPNPSLPRAKQFLSDKEFDRLMAMARRAIEKAEGKMGKSAKSFLDALSWSNIVSLRALAKEKGARGIAGLCTLLEKEAEINEGGAFADGLDRRQVRDYLADVDVEDDDTVYIGRCFEDANAWVRCFDGKCQSERTVDMFVLGPCAKTPGTVFLYGENHSDADREDKTERSGTSRVGKPCDFLYRSSRQEVGVGENTGPKYKDHHEKTRTDFIDLMKVARSQHTQFQTLLIEQSKNPLPKNLQESLASIMIPFFHVVGMKIRFYLLFQINGDLYGVYEWASEDLPIKDADVSEVILLCRRFLVHRYLVDNAERALNLLIKKAKLFKDEMVRERSQSAVQLEHLRTPSKKRGDV